MRTRYCRLKPNATLLNVIRALDVIRELNVVRALNVIPAQAGIQV